MEPLVILMSGRPCGELWAEENGLYVRYRAICRMEPCAEPVRLFAVGERGELRLGVLQPENGCFVLRRQLSAREACAAGKLLRGELRAFAAPRMDSWKSAAEAERLFQEPVLQSRLRGMQGVLVCRSGERRFVALPFDPNRPFPLVELFCLAHVCRIGQSHYAVFCFDGTENPVFF